MLQCPHIFRPYYNALEGKDDESVKPPVICVILILVFSLSAADAQEPLRLTRLAESIQLDGISNEPEWQKIEPLPMTMNGQRNLNFPDTSSSVMKMDLWLVYNENLNTYRDYDEIPRRLLTRGRTVLLKYTNTFGL